MKQPKSQLKAGIILNYINMGLGNLIPIFYTPIMLSLLGQSEYGLYKLSSSVTSYLSLISMGIGSAVTRYLIKAKMEKGQEEEERVLGLFMVIFQIIAGISLVVGIIFTFNLQIWYGNSLTLAELNRMKILVFIMVCNTALSFSQSPYYSVVSSHEKFIFLQCINIVSTCIGPLLNLLMLFLVFASIGMAVTTLAVGVFCRMAYAVYMKGTLKIRPRYHNLPLGMLGEIWKFSFWIFVSNVVGQLYNATDVIMIGMVPGLATAGVAVYNIGVTLSSMIGNISAGISSLMAPSANRMVFQGADGEKLTTLAIRVGRIQGYIASLLVSGFIAFGQPFVFLYAGRGYEDSYWVAIWIACPAIIYLVQSVCLSILVAENKHRFRSLMYLFIAILNVVGTWFLMKIWGVVGAAAMSGVATIIGQGFIMNWYYDKKTILNIRRFWKEVFPVFVVPAGMATVVVGMKKLIDFYCFPIFILGIVIYSLTFFVLTWTLTMNEYEKSVVLGLLHKERAEV